MPDSLLAALHAVRDSAGARPDRRGSLAGKVDETIATEAARPRELKNTWATEKAGPRGPLPRRQGQRGLAERAAGRQEESRRRGPGRRRSRTRASPDRIDPPAGRDPGHARSPCCTGSSASVAADLPFLATERAAAPGEPARGTGQARDRPGREAAPAAGRPLLVEAQYGETVEVDPGRITIAGTRDARRHAAHRPSGPVLAQPRRSASAPGIPSPPPGRDLPGKHSRTIAQAMEMATRIRARRTAVAAAREDPADEATLRLRGPALMLALAAPPGPGPARGLPPGRRGRAKADERAAAAEAGDPRRSHAAAAEVDASRSRTGPAGSRTSRRSQARMTRPGRPRAKLAEAWAAQRAGQFKEISGNVRLAATRCRDPAAPVAADRRTTRRAWQHVRPLLDTGYFPDIDDISGMAAVVCRRDPASPARSRCTRATFVGRDGQRGHRPILSLGRFTAAYRLGGRDRLPELVARGRHASSPWRRCRAAASAATSAAISTARPTGADRPLRGDALRQVSQQESASSSTSRRAARSCGRSSAWRSSRRC